MAGIPVGIQTRPLHKLLQNSCHVDTGQPPRLYLPVPIDRAEQRSGHDAGLLDPGLQDTYRTRLGARPVWYLDLAANSLLITLASAQRHRQAIPAEGAILNVQPNQ